MGVLVLLATRQLISAFALQEEGTHGNLGTLKGIHIPLELRELRDNKNEAVNSADDECQ